VLSLKFTKIDVFWGSARTPHTQPGSLQRSPIAGFKEPYFQVVTVEYYVCRHTWDVVGSLEILLQISSWFWQWKRFDEIFHEHI